MFLWFAQIALAAVVWSWITVRMLGRRLPQRQCGLLQAMDEGHLTDAFMEQLDECQKSGEDLPPVGCPASLYARWAARLAGEFKLEHGIPTRTAANRSMARDVLYRRLKARNTRYAHMRGVLPLAIELCFLKDEADLELDSIMRTPAMVERAQVSVVPYWGGALSWGWGSKVMDWLYQLTGWNHLKPAALPGFSK